MQPQLNIIIGATCSGKEAVALGVAQKIGAQIVVVDSMKIYRELNIGTAKPTLAQQKLVTHHGLDLITPQENFSVADYLVAAQTAIEKIHHEKDKIVLVGGTALYYKALLEGLCVAPPADLSLRAELTAFAEQYGENALYERLQKIDALAAAKLHPHDQRRVIRALEVAMTTGEPLSKRQTQWAGFHQPSSAMNINERVKIFLFSWERSLLRSRISERVERMIKDGLLDEARDVYQNRETLARAPLQAVGYKEFFPYFAGEMNLPAAIDLLKTRTAQLAKSQMTWFRKFPAQVINLVPENTTEEIVEIIVNSLSQ